jgi:hypothetical protein
MRSWPFYFKTEVVLGYLYTILRFVMFCSFAYVKKIPQFLLIQLKYKLKGKNRFSRFRIRRFFGFDFKQNRPSLFSDQTIFRAFGYQTYSLQWVTKVNRRYFCLLLRICMSIPEYRKTRHILSTNILETPVRYIWNVLTYSPVCGHLRFQRAVETGRHDNVWVKV